MLFQPVRIVSSSRRVSTAEVLFDSPMRPTLAGRPELLEQLVSQAINLVQFADVESHFRLSSLRCFRPVLYQSRLSPSLL